MKLSDQITRRHLFVAFGTSSQTGSLSSVDLAATRDDTSVALTASDGSVAPIAGADASNAGVMTAMDKMKLDNLPPTTTRNFAAFAEVPGTIVRNTITHLRTAGRANAGDGGGALYKRVGADPGHPGKVQSADGAWWELVYEGRHDVRQFGVVLDAATDSTAALQAAADFLAFHADDVVNTGTSLAKKHRAVLHVPPGDGCLITATVTVKQNISVQCDAPILVSAAAGAVPAGAAWLDIADLTVALQPTRGVEHVIDIRRVTTSDWASEADTGVRLTAAASIVHMRRVDGFTVGARLTVPFCKVFSNEYRDCKFGLSVERTADHFTNQAQFFGGSFAVASTAGSGLARYGIRLTDNGNGGQNSLTFIGQSFDGLENSAGGAEAIPYLIDDFDTSLFMAQRTENSGTTFAKLSGDCRHLQFELLHHGFGEAEQQSLNDLSTYKINNRIFGARKVAPRGGYLVFDSGRLIDRVNDFDGTTWTVRGMEFAQNNGAAPSPPTFRPYGVITPNLDDGTVSLSTSNYLGIRLDTSVHKTFAFVRSGPTGEAHTVRMLAFGADGTQLTGNTDVLKGDQATPEITSITGAYGGRYDIGNTIDDDVEVAIVTAGPNTGTLFLGIASASKITGLKVFCLDGNVAVTSVSEEDYNGQPVASAAPTQGAYQQGQQFWNTGAAAGGSPGWVCTQGGQFGTLNGGATTGTGTSGNDSLTVNSATGLKRGYWITVDANSYQIRWVAGTTVWLTSNLLTSPAASAVSYRAPVFKAMANVAV